MPSVNLDKDLAQYRDLLETPAEFRDGFGWTTIIGILFCALIMLPGSIYLGLMTGGNMNAAATWVTVILFSEIARRALKTLSKQNLVVLLYAAGTVMGGYAVGGPFGDLIFRAYLITSQAVRDAGMTEAFPRWYAPAPDSSAILERNLFHTAWLIPLLLILFMQLIHALQSCTLGYFFFRLTSDVEKLPFPMAPISAQGSIALAEADEESKSDIPTKLSDSQSAQDQSLEQPKAKKKSENWRIFSLGVTLGIMFGFFQVGLPALTGLFLAKPFFLIPTPFWDTTTVTETVLPAAVTGVALDLGVILVGMVLPFWSVIGAFIAICATFILNPILHQAGVLQQWQPGMNTVNTAFVNGMDFWISFGIGSAFGIAVVSIYQTIRDVMRMNKERRQADQAFDAARDGQRKSMWDVPRQGRGDYPIWIALLGYAVSATLLVVVSFSLLPKQWNILLFLIFFAFIYSPFISYINARLLGLAGQQVDIPMVRETSFILSGAKGVEIWLAPIPLTNIGGVAQSYRINELTGVTFWSIIKTTFIIIPLLFLISWLFWGFIWRSGPIPSEAFPAAQINWELQAKNTVLFFSSTHVSPGDDPNKSFWDTQFGRSIHPEFIGAGFGFCIVAFSLISVFGLPTLMLYGMIRGLGVLPHYLLLEIVGALLARYYFKKKFGEMNFLRMAPTLLAGYFTGVGLVGMATIAMNLIKQAVSAAPF